jgi:DNA polymerase III alpha subunit
MNNQQDTAEKRAKELNEIFGQNHFYLELQKHMNIPEQDILNTRLIEISRKLGIPLVATNDTIMSKLQTRKHRKRYFVFKPKQLLMQKAGSYR